MDQYRDLFPVTREWVYLNHASCGPMPTVVTQAVVDFTLAQSCGGSAYLDNAWPARRVEVRRRMAELINASPDEVAVVKNVAEGMSTVASGLRWQPGDNVVTDALEFPANVYPWLNMKRFGVETRFVPGGDGRIPLDHLLAAVDERTRVVTISFVGFSTGFRHDLDAIGDFCRQRGIYFAVDAIQALGVLPIDVKKSKIDFLASSSHKWLCAPFGVGWFYCRKELLDDLWLAEVGQSSVLPHIGSFLNYNFTLRPTAERFENGVINVAGIVGLGAALDLFLSIGTANIERRILALTDLLVDELRASGYKVLSSRRPGEKSGIVLFASDRYSSAELLTRLTEAKVVVSLREGGIRVAPNFYNNEEDIMRLIKALP